MKEQYINIKLRNNSEKGRFEMIIDGYLVKIEKEQNRDLIN